MIRSFINKDFMPIAINIRNQRILLIGGGHVALHKIASLRQYQAELHVLAIHVSEEIKNQQISYTEKSYERNDLIGAFLVYACTNIKLLNELIYSDCQELGILVNVVDNPLLCDFVSPAIYKKDYLSVAVSSNARDVYKSIEVRNKIKTILENDLTLQI
jgi:precorrin-2 dehydrogenase / sirohydrochlorin ferrochelatase